jgi:polar amino acid transport system substrate-binding protein
MTRRTWTLVAVSVVLAALAFACSSAGRRPSEPAAPVSTTTSTTTEATADPGFRTRVKGVLTVATDHMVEPYYIESNGQIIGGFEYDLAKAIASSLRVSVRVVPLRLVSIVSGRDCGCDLYLGQAAATESLARSTDLSEPYLAADQAVIVRAGSTVVDTATARALRWGTTMRDAVAVDLVQRQLKPAPALELFAGHDDLIGAVADGNVDAALLDVPSALLAAQADPRVTVAGRIATGGSYAAVLPLGSPNTSALNDLIRRLRDNGTLGVLSRLFFGSDPAAVPVLKLT